MYRRALQGYERALGPKQVDSYLPALKTTKRLARTLASQGRKSEARALYLRCQEGFESVLGAQHEGCKLVREELEALDALEDGGSP